MDQQQLRLTPDNPTRDAELHRVLFDVMLAALEQTDPAPSADRIISILRDMQTDSDLTVPARFEAMRALFVLGRSVPPDCDRRAHALDLLTGFGVAEAPPLPGGDPLKLSLRNNHLLLQAAMLLAWPEVGQGRAMAERLVVRYLNEIDEAGRFPVEMCRGASALWYSNLAVMLLTAIAFADRHSHSPIVSRQTLAHVIAGLNKALTDPAAVRPHARRNLFAHPDHGRDPNRLDTGFLSGYRRSRHYMAWTVLAKALLGNTAVPLDVPPDDRFPICSDFVGGFTDAALRAPDQQPTEAY